MPGTQGDQLESIGGGHFRHFRQSALYEKLTISKGVESIQGTDVVHS